MQLRACSLTLLLMISLASACGTAVATPTPITLRVGGSTSLAPALDIWTDAYTAAHPHIRFEGEPGDSLYNKERLMERRLDIAASSWEPEVTGLADLGFQAFLAAWDGIAIVVHPRNVVTDTTLSQLHAIYAGHTLGWQALGGEAGEVTVVSREEGSGTRQAFESMVMGEAEVTLAAIVMPSSAAVVEYVSAHPDAMGYVSMAFLTDRVRALRVENELPTPLTVRQGLYPLSRPLFLVTSADPSDDVRSFIEYVVSVDGQSLIADRYGAVR